MSLPVRRTQAAPWLKDALWRKAQAVPSLDLRFADNKSLVDSVSGQNLITFSRASGGTYIDSTGTLRSAVTNLLLQSENFATTWFLTSATLSSDAIAAPNGSLTAEQLIEDATTANHEVAQTFASPVANATYTLSCYLKAATSTTCGLRFTAGLNGTGVICSIDLTAQTATVTAGTGTATIANVGSGWFRVSLTATASGTPSSTTVNIFRSIGIGGSIANSIYIWGAQLEQSSTVGEYIPTTSAINSAPRFDHNPLTGESLGLLVEEQRTNSIRNNTMVGAVVGTPGTLPTNWAVSGLGTLTQQIVGVGVVDGVSYIDIRFSGTTSTTQAGIRLESGSGAPGTNGQTFTYSAWLARIAGSASNVTAITCNTNLYDAGGAYITSPGFTGFDSAANPTSFIRRAGTLTIASATSAFIQPQIAISFASGVAIDITLRIGLPQLEQGAFATSVIPTTTAAATRSADVVEITGSNFSRWYRQDQGTLFSETQWAFTHTATVPIGLSSTWEINNTATSNNNYCILGNSATTADQSQGRNPTIGLNRPSIFGFGFKQAGVLYKTAFGWNPSVLQHSTNTLLSNASTNTVAALMATHDRMLIGQATGGSPPAQLNGTIRRLTYFPARLPNTTLQRLTQ